MNTYLYIKRHKATGLLYFGKTVNNPVKYPGSGLHWKNHCRVHGKEHVETIWYCLFNDEATLTEFALMCSTMWDIVQSEAWANKVPENGIDGGRPGPRRPRKSRTWTEEEKLALRGPRGKQQNPRSGMTVDHREALKAAAKGRRPPTQAGKISINNGVVNRQLFPDDAKPLLANGWVKGRLKLKSVKLD